MVRSSRFFLVNFSRRDFVDDFVQARNPKLLPVGYRHSLIADDIVTRGPIRPFVTKSLAAELCIFWLPLTLKLVKLTLKRAI